MSALKNTQDDFWMALQPGSSAGLTGLRDHGALDAQQRLEIYQNMYVFRLVDSLREDFPAVARLLGDESFFGLCRAYLARHPSEDASIMHMGRHLAAFVALQRTGRPDVADLADLEWARAVAFEAPDAAALEPQALAALGDRLASARLRFAPALQQLTLTYDIIGLWRVLQDKAENIEIPAPAAMPTHVVVWRPRYEVLHTALAPEAAEALKRARAGATVAEVCDAFAQLPQPIEAAFAAIGAWLADGWVVAADLPEE